MTRSGGTAAGALRGWLVVGGAFLAMFAAFGSKYAFAAFFRPLELEFGAGRAEIALVFSICAAAYLTLGAVTGLLADRFGPRPLLAIGTLLLSGSLFVAGQADSLTDLYLIYGIGAATGIACIYVPAVSSVQGWFDGNRALASGLAVTGIAVGTLVMPLAAAAFIAGFGWRATYPALAAVTLVLGGCATLLVDRRPEAAGAPALRSFLTDDTRLALRSPVFARLFLANTVLSFGLFIPFVHLEPFARDAGLDVEQAVLLVGLIGIGSIGGRFLIGSAADRFGRRRALTAMLAGMGLSQLCWPLADSFLGLAAFALVFGAVYGGYAATIPPVCADYFGGARLSGIIGCLYTAVAIGTLAGPVLAGLAHDLTASYTVPIVGGGLLSLLAAVLVATMISPAAWQARTAALHARQSLLAEGRSPEGCNPEGCNDDPKS